LQWVYVAMLAGSAAVRVISILSADTIDQSHARVFSLSCSGILHYYALCGCSRRYERAVRKERRNTSMQQTAVEVLPVVTQFLKNVLCRMHDLFGHTGPSSDTCVRKNTGKSLYNTVNCMPSGWGLVLVRKCVEFKNVLNVLGSIPAETQDGLLLKYVNRCLKSGTLFVKLRDLQQMD